MDKGHSRGLVLSAFVEDRERVNDTDDGLTVLEEWGTRKFFDMQEPRAFAGSMIVPPTTDCDLLQAHICWLLLKGQYKSETLVCVCVCVYIFLCVHVCPPKIVAWRALEAGAIAHLIPKAEYLPFLEFY